MAGRRDHGKRLRRAVDALRAIDDPITRLDATRAAREELERRERDAVADCRDAGHTWTDIGARYGLTRQGAQQRFRRHHRKSDPGSPPGPAGPRSVTP
ncbi:MAG: helix-turn-helix domain-containing protein [Nakamurella sp.]